MVLCIGIITLITLLGKFISWHPIHLVCSYVFFLPQILSGVIIYLCRENKMTNLVGVFYIMMNYFLILHGIQIYDFRFYIDTPYMPSFFYAILVFIVALKIELKSNLIITFLANISACTYLSHWLFGNFISGIFESFHIKYSFVFLFSVIFCILAGAFLHFLFEKPLRRLLRKI